MNSRRIVLVILMLVVLTLVVVWLEGQRGEVETRGSIWRTPAPARQDKPSNMRGWMEYWARRIRRIDGGSAPSETPWPTATTTFMPTPLPYPQATMTMDAYP